MKKLDFVTLKTVAKERLSVLQKLREEAKQAILNDLAQIHTSCPCGKDGKCANIDICIPLIQNKHRLPALQSSLDLQEKLMDDLHTRDPSISYSGIVITDVIGNPTSPMPNFIVLNFLNIGPGSAKQAFAHVMETEKCNHLYIYSTLSKEKIESVLALKATLLVDVKASISLQDFRSDRQLFLLEKI
jgi:hypothetical protein